MMIHAKSDEPVMNEEITASSVQLVYGPPVMKGESIAFMPFGMMNTARIREYTENDLPEMIAIWNAVVAAGNAFPQEEMLTAEEGAAFFAQQIYCGVAELDGKICGLYILHPNNVGRCGHIANASYAVHEDFRGQSIGRQLVQDCIERGRQYGFRILQFNAVVESNTAARMLYEKLGFVQLGTIPEGFRMLDGSYVNICPYYLSLTE